MKTKSCLTGLFRQNSQNLNDPDHLPHFKLNF
jgi:hypothetical protein